MSIYKKDEEGKMLYGWKTGMKHHFVENRKVTNLLYYDRCQNSVNHPTMKPIELIKDVLNNSSYADDIVFDPFGGSMSTLFACHEMGRICRTIELYPAYIAGAISTWLELYPNIKPIINGVEICQTN